MKTIFYLLIFSLMFFFNNTSNAQKIGRADEAWKTIKTEHFDIIISAEQQNLGLYYAEAAEKAYQNLSLVFSQRTEKITLIVNDTTDMPNGYATRIPYPHIMAYSVPIGDHEALSEAGDWARELVTHELTHIFQFEPATGFYSWLRPIFGNIIAPNMLTPLWWKEGMAVEMETQFSPRGRTRSTYQNASLRSLVLDKKIFHYTLAQANEALPSWPYGSRPYLFGSLFFSQLNFETKNIKSTSYLADRQGERLPYFIEEPLRELTNNSYEMQYLSALHAVEVSSTQQINKLKSQALTQTEIIPQENEFSFYPTYSSSFKLLAFIADHEGSLNLKILDDSGAPLKLSNLPSGNLLNIDFHPSEKKIIYTKIDKVDSQHSYSDLYVYDVNADNSEQLTFAQRVRSANYSASGNQIVFLTTFGGLTQIRTMSVAEKSIRFIIGSAFGFRYESPIFWDDSTLLAVKINPDGRHDLVKINLHTQVETTVNLNFQQIRFLNKKNNSLYFISSKNGINNIYVTTDLVSAKPVSHFLTGSWSFALNAEETLAWATLMTSQGFKITKVHLNQNLNELPVIEDEFANRYHFVEETFTPKKYEITDYTASNYLWPSYWIPFISTSSSAKGFFLLAQTTGQDPIKKHQYSLSANYNSEINKGNFSGLYINSTQNIPIKFSSILQSWALGSALSVVENTTNSVSLLPDMFELNRHLFLEVGAQVQNTYYITKSQHAGPFIELMYKNYEQNIFQISPESGWGGLIKFEKNYKLSDDTDFIAQDYEKAYLSLLGFASPWLPTHHAIKARLSTLLTFSSVYGRYGSSNTSSFLENDTLAPQFVMRAYPSAQFFGRSIWNANLEYRFPVSNIERGSGTDAYFLKKITGAVVFDGLGVEGSGLAENLQMQNLKLNESLWNSGLELKLETTIGYVLPMNFVLGYYIPHSPLFASGSQLGLSLQIGGF